MNTNPTRFNHLNPHALHLAPIADLIEWFETQDPIMADAYGEAAAKAAYQTITRNNQTAYMEAH